MGARELEASLSYLANDPKVSPTTHRQALPYNAAAVPRATAPRFSKSEPATGYVSKLPEETCVLVFVDDRQELLDRIDL